MSVSIIRKPIYGSLLEYNKLCSGEPYISIPGIYAKAPARLDVDNDIMSKHILMSGGTGSGKTNAIYHILSRLVRFSWLTCSAASRLMPWISMIC